MLESKCHPDNSFITLTYDESNFPSGASLVPRDVTNFVKRFRKRLAPHRIRYYFVGEYGDKSERPHYHAAIFGAGSNLFKNYEEILFECWQKGYCYPGQLTYDSAQYIAGYVTKKLTSADDPRLDGRHPEFARMSNRPGIGALAVPAFADALGDFAPNPDLGEDVPVSFRAGGQSRPLGRYLRSKLRTELGLNVDQVKENTRYQQVQEMYALYESAGSTAAFVQAKENLDKQKRLEVTAKHDIYSTKVKL